ncbi:hypothetical protein MJA45_28505 [Paenibacillus aurantius]|uniref:Uncharacterized protein n=1 Tax=Paenibacillus aurantius TaxID=2918900 RepID=A0AA96RHU6_9BACL|nr:hypothetical protein [Paenibacillus aurantius]WNQ11489.1 hypothetical protein MJA45_28505 [Paenibacillus aurantius]
MLKPFTFTVIFAVIGLLLCFVHYQGWDPKNIILFSFSVPLWFIPLFTSSRNINPAAAYLLTVASWAVIGYIVDRFVYRRGSSTY